MTLKDYLSEYKSKKPIALINFLNDESVEFDVKIYRTREFRFIHNDILNKEVMDIIEEEDCIEIWIK